MKDINSILKERDQLIDQLILSHLQTLMRMYDIQTADEMKMARRHIYNPFALDDIVDRRLTNETLHVLQDYSEDAEKIAEVIDGRRKRELENTLRTYSSTLRHKYLKKIKKNGL